VLIGFSAGGFGGGSNLVAQPVTSLPFGRGEPRFGLFDDREDLDAMAFWTLQNLGVGNKSQIEAARSRLSSADFELLVTLDRIRSEVAGAHSRTHARFAQIRSCELAIQTSTRGFAEDMTRIQGQEGLPLEAVDSLRLLGKSRIEYLNAILDYNQAHFQLYVALGKPPGELLMRSVDPDDERHPDPPPDK
jgi:outer membrane protein TolC